MTTIVGCIENYYKMVETPDGKVKCIYLADELGWMSGNNQEAELVNVKLDKTNEEIKPSRRER